MSKDRILSLLDSKNQKNAVKIVASVKFEKVHCHLYIVQIFYTVLLSMICKVQF